MKKTISILLAFILLFSSSITLNATTYTNNSLLSEDAISFISEKDKTISDDAIPLYNYDDEIIAYYFSLLPIGYIICDTSGNIIECSFEETRQITDNINYYISPTVICNKESNTFYNISSGTSYNTEEIQVNSSYFSETIQSVENSTFNTSEALITPRIPSYAALSGTCRKYDYNPDGICGSTAAAIFFMYYNDYIDDYMVLSSYETSDGVKLIELLEPHIDGDEPGSITTELVSGMNWYLHWKGRSAYYTAVASIGVSYSTYQSIINNDRPAIVGLTGAPTYGEHWVVGHGYQKYVRADRAYCYYIINDGWGSNSVYVLSDYVDDIAYLKHL